LPIPSFPIASSLLIHAFASKTCRGKLCAHQLQGSMHNILNTTPSLDFHILLWVQASEHPSIMAFIIFLYP